MNHESHLKRLVCLGVTSFFVLFFFLFFFFFFFFFFLNNGVSTLEDLNPLWKKTKKLAEARLFFNYF